MEPSQSKSDTPEAIGLVAVSGAESGLSASKWEDLAPTSTHRRGKAGRCVAGSREQPASELEGRIVGVLGRLAFWGSAAKWREAAGGAAGGCSGTEAQGSFPALSAAASLGLGTGPGSQRVLRRKSWDDCEFWQQRKTESPQWIRGPSTTMMAHIKNFEE